MPGGRTLPNLGLQAFFDLGEDGWDIDPSYYMSLNLLKLSVLVQGGVISKVAATPGAPTNGDVHIFSEAHPTQANKVAIRDDGAWLYLTPSEGWLLYNKATNYYESFDGAVWAEFAGGGGGGGGPATETIIVALGDETTDITVGVAKVTLRMPYGFTLTAVRSSLTTASSSGLVTVDINEGGATILSTKLSIDSGEKTSTTAATAAVMSDTALADDAELTFDIDAAGTGAKGLKVYLIGHQ